MIGSSNLRRSSSLPGSAKPSMSVSVKRESVGPAVNSKVSLLMRRPERGLEAGLPVRSTVRIHTSRESVSSFRPSGTNTTLFLSRSTSQQLSRFRRLPYPHGHLALSPNLPLRPSSRARTREADHSQIPPSTRHHHSKADHNSTRLARSPVARHTGRQLHSLLARLMARRRRSPLAQRTPHHLPSATPPATTTRLPRRSPTAQTASWLPTHRQSKRLRNRPTPASSAPRPSRTPRTVVASKASPTPRLAAGRASPSSNARWRWNGSDSASGRKRRRRRLRRQGRQTALTESEAALGDDGMLDSGVASPEVIVRTRGTKGLAPGGGRLSGHGRCRVLSRRRSDRCYNGVVPLDAAA